MHHISALELTATLVLSGLLLAVGWIDARTMRIPDVLTASILVTGLGAVFVLHHMTLWWATASMLGGFGSMWGVRTAYHHIRGEHGLGLGDVKLVGASGAWIGLESLSMMILIASVAALVWIGLQHQRAGLRAKFPFGPFLALGIWVAWMA